MHEAHHRRARHAPANDAMTDDGAHRIGLRLIPHRAAETSASPGHGTILLFAGVTPAGRRTGALNARDRGRGLRATDPSHPRRPRFGRIDAVDKGPAVRGPRHRRKVNIDEIHQSAVRGNVQLWPERHTEVTGAIHARIEQDLLANNVLRCRPNDRAFGNVDLPRKDLAVGTLSERTGVRQSHLVSDAKPSEPLFQHRLEEQGSRAAVDGTLFSDVGGLVRIGPRTRVIVLQCNEISEIDEFTARQQDNILPSTAYRVTLVAESAKQASDLDIDDPSVLSIRHGEGL